MTQVVPGMPADAYDEVIGNIGPALRSAPGFISHATVTDADGATVTEVWESRGQWSARRGIPLRALRDARLPTARR